jgi:hypothetical protein
LRFVGAGAIETGKQLVQAGRTVTSNTSSHPSRINLLGLLRAFVLGQRLVDSIQAGASAATPRW